jgi:quercetin dioxygenase-like cupin family protein
VFIEYPTRKGEEPGRHTHDGEDEIFYVLQGEVEFWCGGETFRVGPNGFVFLPRNIEHGYTILNDGEARLLVVVAPPRWGESIEAEGEPLNELARVERARRDREGPADVQ